MEIFIVYIDRRWVNKAADHTRRVLNLPIPLTLESLIYGIEELGGKCVPDEERILDGRDAKLHLLNKEDDICFEILYSKKCTENALMWALARELGMLLLFEFNEE